MLPAKEIIIDAIERFKPVKIVLMFSGGHDSLVNAHVCANILEKLHYPFVVYHGDTTIGIPETQEYVKKVCDLFNWTLQIRRPPNEKDYYENLVKKFGFPGPTKLSHQIMYRSLKERALRRFVTYECKSKATARENVLLCAGVRKDESQIRMGYSEVTQKDGSKVWTNPIFYWSERDCENYMKGYNLPRNPVKDKICISGECLCGAFARKEEFAELKEAFPQTAARIESIHQLAIDNGKPWPWGIGPKEWRKGQLPKQQNMFMCAGCDKKHTNETP